MALTTPTLHTDRLRLRPFDDTDADDIFALQSDAQVLRYWDSPPWRDRGRAERFIQACRQMAEEGTGVRVAVTGLSDGAFLGWCHLSDWDPTYRSASFGYCFNEAAWGHGYATEAARGLLRWAFDTLDLNRVQAETDTRNVASARVLEKLGFVREGTLREDCVVDGEVSDSWVYGLLRREWRPSSESATRGRRVYVDMVGDLFHAGHVALLREARRHGDRLVVGVLSDETSAAYKRRPVMTLAERVAVIEACRYVDEVIADAPFEVTSDFLDAHAITTVVHGDDLTPEAAASVYGPAVAAGRLAYVERTGGISTSELIQRVLAATQSE